MSLTLLPICIGFIAYLLKFDSNLVTLRHKDLHQIDFYTLKHSYIRLGSQSIPTHSSFLLSFSPISRLFSCNRCKHASKQHRLLQLLQACLHQHKHLAIVSSTYWSITSYSHYKHIFSDTAPLQSLQAHIQHKYLQLLQAHIQALLLAIIASTFPVAHQQSYFIF